ncbi:MAG TPA: hypothetical protein VF721_10455 [Pyrinomonadaceae bacterium]
MKDMTRILTVMTRRFQKLFYVFAILKKSFRNKIGRRRSDGYQNESFIFFYFCDAVPGMSRIVDVCDFNQFLLIQNYFVLAEQAVFFDSGNLISQPELKKPNN